MRKKEQLKFRCFTWWEWLTSFGNLFNLSGQVPLLPLDRRSDCEIIRTDWNHLRNDFSIAATCYHPNTLNYV